jgi:hypothetical protein
MKQKFIFFSLILLLTGCADIDGAKNKKVHSNVEQKMTEGEVRTLKVEKSDFKTWIFEQPIKIRGSADPSAKILASVEEGAKVAAAIKSMGNGWNYIVTKDGVEGFYFGKRLAREISK